MSRRREAREQAREDFFETYPQLFRSETRIEVIRPEEDHGAEDIVSFDIEKDPWQPPFRAQVTVDGEPGDSSTAFFETTPDQTLAFEVRFPGGEVSANPEEKDDDGPEVSLVEEDGFDLLSLTEDGFGVAQSSSIYMPRIVTLEDIPSEMGPSSEDRALNGDERIVIDVRGPKEHRGRDEVSEPGIDEDEGPGFELGGKELGIDFKVLGGSGTVQVVLIDEDDEGAEPLVFEMTAGGSRRRDTMEGRIEAEMEGDSAYDTAYIAVTGDLEITVVGIDMSTNFEAIELVR